MESVMVQWLRLQRPWASRIVVSLVVLGAIGGALFLIFCDGSLRRVRTAGVIRVGYAIEAPYAFVAPDGRVTGESPEIAREIVARIGVGRIVWRQVLFRDLIAELEAGRLDVIAAGMFITPERAERVAFSVPTFQVRQGLLVSRGNPHRLHSYAQAAGTAGVRVAVLAGSVEETVLRSVGVPPDRLVAVSDAATGARSVASGIVQALALSSPTVNWLAMDTSLGNTEGAKPFYQPEPVPRARGAFAFRLGDRRLRAAWNRELKHYLGSPGHRALVARFGFSADELPGSTVPPGGVYP